MYILSLDEINIPLLLFVGFINLLFFYSIIYDKDNNNGVENETNETNENERNSTKPIPYQEKYMVEYKKRIEQTQESKEKRNLKNSFLIEKTPLGNVAMYYNQERECFEYYSDNTIPYRYLETVGRKYVLTFDCLSVYVDMEEELKRQKEKMDLDMEKQKSKTEIEIESNKNLDKESSESTKKTVFAKLKHYNKSSNPNQASTQPTRPNTSQEIPNNQPKKPNTIHTKTTTTTNKQIIIKERSNSYLSKGRFSNLQLLQTIKKEIVDKNYKMSFKDFKQITNNK
jgi:hypothetical protein